MGKWITKQNLKAKIKHECQLPKIKGGFGSVWQCDCGKKWEVKQNILAYYPSKPKKPVFAWGKYGEEDFGLRSALIIGEADE
jgi:hypothetical protein